MDEKARKAYEAAKKKAKAQKDLDNAKSGANMMGDAAGLGGLRRKLRGRQKMLEDI